jgi:membrane-associated phospholipid phosphatase
MSYVEYLRSFSPQWWRLTLLGEPTVLIPVSIIIAIWLWTACSFRVALRWTALLTLGAAILVAQKLLYYVGGFSITSIRLYTMSGHAMAASFVYGSLAALLTRDWRKFARHSAYTITATMVFGIGVSRVLVAGHHLSEAVSGLALGALLMIAFARWLWPEMRPTQTVWSLAIPCLIAISITYGHVFELENIFRKIGAWSKRGA